MTSTREKVQRYIDIAKRNAQDYVVIVLGNVKNLTGNFKDFEKGTTVISEYYSLNQFNMIVDSLRNNGIETVSYFDEMDFIHDFSVGIIRNNYPKKFIVLNFAQKGIVQGRKSLIPVFCEMNDIIHTNSNGFASSFAREKYYWGLCLKNYFTTPECWVYDNKIGWLQGSPNVGVKVIAKLTNQASSIGLDSTDSVFEYSNNKDKYISNLSKKYCEPVMVQEFICGQEAEVPIFYDGNDCFALPPAGIIIDGTDKLYDKFLDYDKRGNQGFSRFDFSAKYPNTSEYIQSNAVNIAKFMDLQGICRIDYRIDESGKCFVTDINCNPHLTATSCICKSLGYLGFKDYDATVLALIGLTINRHPN